MEIVVVVPTERRQRAAGVPGLWGHCSHCVGGVTVAGMSPKTVSVLMSLARVARHSRRVLQPGPEWR